MNEILQIKAKKSKWNEVEDDCIEWKEGVSYEKYKQGKNRPGARSQREF